MIRARALALAAAAVGLLSLVALASQRPLLRARTHAERAASSNWVPAVLLLVLAVLGVAASVYGMRRARRDGQSRSQAAGWRLIGVLTIVILVSLILHDRLHHRTGTPTASTPSSGSAQPVTKPAPAPRGRTPRSTGATWWEVAGLAAAAGLAVAAARFTRRPEVATIGDVHPGRLAGVLDDSLEDLRRDPDARRAVVATYARMEGGLAVSGLPRHPSDTPFEYLGRLLSAHQVSGPAASRLTDLFEQAKFSNHLIDNDIRQEAIAALEAVRDELRVKRLNHVSEAAVQ